tara:strand:- start:3139 stop:4461 length:1323 start_codon:yes stop_codon:yes gene_type:complete
MSENKTGALEQEEVVSENTQEVTQESNDTQVDEASYPGAGKDKQPMEKASASAADTGVDNQKVDGPKPNFTKGVPTAKKRPADKTGVSESSSKMALIKSIYNKLDEMTKDEVAEVLGALEGVEEEEVISEEEIYQALLDEGFTEEEIEQMSEEKMTELIQKLTSQKVDEQEIQKSALNQEEFEANLADDVQALIEGEELSDDFKEKAATIFEAAVFARVNEEITNRVEKLEEQYKVELEEAVEGNKKEMVERVDDFMNYVVKEWMQENELAIEKGIRSEIVEDFMVGLKNLFVEHYIDIPDEKVDLVDDLFTKVEDLEESLNQEIDKNIQTNKELREYKKLDALYTVSEGLTDVETEKMQKLAEGIEYETEELYAEKLQTIKENYFPGKEQQQTLTEDTSVQTQDDMEVINEEGGDEVALAETPESIRRYADAISRTLKK